MFATGPFDCTGVIDASPNGLTRNFSWQVESCGGLVQTVRLDQQSADDGSWQQVAGNPSDDMFTGVGPGLYRLLVSSTDSCTQDPVVDTLYAVVQDAVAPRVICRSNQTIALAEEGVSWLSAVAFGADSEDNCRTVTLSIRRAVAATCLDALQGSAFDRNEDGVLDAADGFSVIDGVTYTPWSREVPFFCCDAGQSQLVELRAVDPAGNSAQCLQTVAIVDATTPECQAPPGVRLGCNDVRLQNRQRLGMAQARQDLCGTITIEELPAQENLDDCGAGTIIRSFQAVKQAGTPQEERSAICRQTIQVVVDHHYAVSFPADTTMQCLQDAQLPGVIVQSDACELFAVTQNDERVFPAAGDTGSAACYDIRRTYQVINWCEYDGNAPPVVVGRDWDGWNGTNPSAPQGNGVPGDRGITVTVARYLNDVFPDTVWYDADTDPANEVPAHSGVRTENGYYWQVISGNANPDSEIYYTGNGTTWGNVPFGDTSQATGFGSNGFWQYTQVIRIQDETPPVLTVVSERDTFAAVSGSDCAAEVSLLFGIADDCLLAWHDYGFEVELDLFSDGEVDEAPYLDLALFPELLIAGRYPLGTHQLTLAATDLCGNRQTLVHTFTVVDRRAPRPVCINGLTVELEPAPPGDSIGRAGVPIFVDNFVAGMAEDCSGEVHYSINLIGEDFQPGQDGLVLTCADLGTVVVEIHAWDDAGNRGSCETYVLVQDRKEPVCRSENLAYLSGLVTTPDLVPLPETEVQLTGPFERTRLTDAFGSYAFSNIASGFSYEVTPTLDRDYINGVSTYDIYLIQQHILGVEPFSTPYEYIAADANRSGTVSVSDMVQIRKLVLSVDVTLPDNTSWRFVDARHRFDRPQDALEKGFPERIVLPELPADSLILDFTAVKIGDVSGNALTEMADVRSFYAEGELPVLLPDMLLRPGVVQRIPVRLAATRGLQSLQFALDLSAPGVHVVDIVEGLIPVSQMGLFAEAKVVSASWIGNRNTTSLPDTTLFTMLLEVDRPVYLSEVIRLSTRYTPGEAVLEGAVFIPQLQISEHPADPHNLQATVFPNPMTPGGTSFLQFTLPAAANVQIELISSNGQVLAQKSEQRPAGPHIWTLPGELLSQSGWYLLRLSTPQQTITLPLMVSRS